MQPIFFQRPADFRSWLAKNHADASVLIVGFHKVDSGKPSMTWSQSVDEALCFGWIDGVRRSLDAHSYCIRFTPRKQDSRWSKINLAKVAALKKAGRMAPAGLAIHKVRDRAKEQGYSYELPDASFSTAQVKQFKSNRIAWKFFESQPPYYRRLMVRWITEAKQPATQLRRLKRLIDASAAGRRVL